MPCRPDAKIVPPQIQFLVASNRTHDSAAASIGGVNPIIQAVLKTVYPVLLIAFMEPGVEQPAHIGPSVTIRILRVDDIRRRAD